MNSSLACAMAASGITVPEGGGGGGSVGAWGVGRSTGLKNRPRS